MSDTITVKCIECGTTVTLTQPIDHSEYVPSGKCPQCDVFHYVSYSMDGDMRVNATRLVEAHG